MRYPPIDAALFVRNRAELAAKLPPNTLAVIQSNDVFPQNADATLPFVQNSDLLYLTGIAQPHTTLLLYPDAPNPDQRELLFIERTTPQQRTWEGEKLTPQQATTQCGVAHVHYQTAFNGIFHALMGQTHNVYLLTNEHSRATATVKTANERFATTCRDNYPVHTYGRLAPLLAKLRACKTPTEVALIRHAYAITGEAFRELLAHVRPGAWEYALEAELSRAFLRQGSRGFAYPPIIASGANSCVLHYVDNDQVCLDEDVLLLDIGAEYAHYGADLTRTVPINGRFTPRQREVYQAVLRVQEHAKTLLKPGACLPDYQKEVAAFMEEQLWALKLITKEEVAQQDPQKPAYKRYFMHGTSHHLGIDTHDVGDMHAPLQPGMVLTVEPGIYIPEERLGIRLENAVLIGERGAEDLCSDIPIEVEDIEHLMKKKTPPPQ